MPKNKNLHGKKPKVAQIITRMVPGGASRIVRQIIDGLNNDFSIDLITGVEDLPSEFTEKLKSTDEIITIPSLKRDISPLNDLGALFSLVRALTKRDYDLIHTHTSKAGFLGRLAGYCSGVPGIIHSTHGLIYDSATTIPGVPSSTVGQKLLALLERSIKFTHDRITTLTRREKEQITRLNIANAENTQTVYNGVDIEYHQEKKQERNSLRKSLQIPDDNVLIVSVGRLAKEKGHDVLLESFRRLKTDYDNVNLLIAGDGPKRFEYESEYENEVDNNLLYFMGHVNNIRKVYSAADIYVQPSLYEGFGLSVLEAMSYGLPILATKVGGIPELIDHGEHGFLVKPGEQEEIIKYVQKIMNNNSLRHQLGNQARKQSKQFSLDKMLSQYNKIYCNFLGNIE